MLLVDGCSRRDAPPPHFGGGWVALVPGTLEGVAARDVGNQRDDLLSLTRALLRCPPPSSRHYLADVVHFPCPRPEVSLANKPRTRTFAPRCSL